ncbi:CLUMA_CG019470, isoform A [Clunio marinus]|uniref:CLUMA_CG019470, isoform A n=1 Tax=Clunio marinus TaxID=568069 RepID=A0A1J1J6Z9_9DIPT|nr:CLUMA_CG019470, isoform A [Clunio marinus]
MIDHQPPSGYPFFPIEMKCTTIQPPQMTIANENCSSVNNNASNNRAVSNSIAGTVVDGTGILTQINPSPIVLQQQGNNNQMTSMNVSSPPEHHHKSPTVTSTGSSSSSCGSCLQPICDRYIMKVVETPYHERCLQCFSCCCSLMTTCYQRDNKLYCRIDYERLFVKNRCLGCGEKIGSDELVMRAVNNVFHLKCFICVVCGVRLQKGDQYVIKQSQLFCRPDYEKEVEMFQGYNYDDYCCEDVYHTRIDGRRGPKRPRRDFINEIRAFKASFDISPKPCRKIREGLAKDTGLSIRIVQVWFQNQRAKVKKIQKKQLKEGGKLKDNESQEESENESKMSVKIKDENSRSNQYLQDSCSDTENGMCDTDSFGSRLSGNGSSSIAGEFKHIKEEIENDEDYFRLLANQTRTMRQFDDGATSIKSETMAYNNLMGMDYQSLQHLASLVPTSQILNPIDRLYSMQNQYFCNETQANMHHPHHQMCE